jgi:hypothetical protein
MAELQQQIKKLQASRLIASQFCGFSWGIAAFLRPGNPPALRILVWGYGWGTKVLSMPPHRLECLSDLPAASASRLLNSSFVGRRLRCLLLDISLSFLQSRRA